MRARGRSAQALQGTASDLARLADRPEGSCTMGEMFGDRGDGLAAGFDVAAAGVLDWDGPWSARSGPRRLMWRGGRDATERLVCRHRSGNHYKATHRRVPTGS
ncbi:hypothetical protein GCM10018965_011700 [Nonomuraea roseola]